MRLIIYIYRSQNIFDIMQNRLCKRDYNNQECKNFINSLLIDRYQSTRHQSDNTQGKYVLAGFPRVHYQFKKRKEKTNFIF